MPSIAIFLVGCWVGVIFGFIIFAFLNTGNRDDL